MPERADCLSMQGRSTPKAGKNCVRRVPLKHWLERHRMTGMKLMKGMVRTVSK